MQPAAVRQCARVSARMCVWQTRGGVLCGESSVPIESMKLRASRSLWGALCQKESDASTACTKPYETGTGAGKSQGQ